MFAAIKWETPLPWEKKGPATNDQEAANRAAVGLLDQIGPISLRKARGAGPAGPNAQSTKSPGTSSNLVSRALVPSAEQMMSTALIGSSASRYAVIKERRTGFFLDTSQDSVNLYDQKPSPGAEPSSADSLSPLPESNQKSLSRRNSASVGSICSSLSLSLSHSSRRREDPPHRLRLFPLPQPPPSRRCSVESPLCFVQRAAPIDNHSRNSYTGQARIFLCLTLLCVCLIAAFA
jgi:hypothetical protein